MTTFYFHEYAGATYNRANFDDFCKEKSGTTKSRRVIVFTTQRRGII